MGILVILFCVIFFHLAFHISDFPSHLWYFAFAYYDYRVVAPRRQLISLTPPPPRQTTPATGQLYGTHRGRRGHRGRRPRQEMIGVKQRPAGESLRI